MKRPLGVFGGVFLLGCLAATLLPEALRLPACALFAAVLFVCVLLRRKVTHAAGAAVLAGALALGFGAPAVYGAVWVRPVASLEGRQGMVQGRVEDVLPGNSPDTQHITLRVRELDGEGVRSFRIRLYDVEGLAIGDVVSAEVQFRAFSPASQSYNYSKGYYIAASAKGEIEKTGQDMTLLCRFRLLQYAASGNIRARLPQRLGSVVAAMTVGDRNHLPGETVDAYRVSGLSHLLVVSGLHLSIVSGLVYLTLSKLVRRRRLAGIVCIAFILGFMLLTGLCPSVVRAGVAVMLACLGPVLARRADIYTSLGFAALLLCLQNPYAATDAGLLLSFSATLGALGASEITRWLKARRQSKMEAPAAAVSWPRRFAIKLLAGAGQLMLTSLCVTLATLPVLVGFGMGVSLLSIVANVVAVPLLAPIVVCGFFLALPLWPVVNATVGVAGLVAGALAAFLERFTGWLAGLGFGMVYLDGIYALAAILLFYLLVFLAFRTRRVLAFVVCAALLLPGVVVLHSLLTADLVTIAVAGYGQNASLVVMRGDEAVVLYRSRTSIDAIERTMRENGVGECVLLVDLRRTPSDENYLPGYPAAQVVIAESDVVSHGVYTPVEGMDIYLRRQEGGNFACVQVGGYRVGLCSGSFNLANYGEIDVLLAGAGEVRGEYGMLLAGQTVPPWVPDGQDVYIITGDAQLLVRPHKSIRWRRVAYAEPVG